MGDSVRPGGGYTLRAPNLGKLKMRFTDDDGIPLAFYGYTVDGSGVYREGFLDEDGCLLEENLPETQCRVVVHGLEDGGQAIDEIVGGSGPASE